MTERHYRSSLCGWTVICPLAPVEHAGCVHLSAGRGRECPQRYCLKLWGPRGDSLGHTSLYVSFLGNCQTLNSCVWGAGPSTRPRRSCPVSPTPPLRGRGPGSHRGSIRIALTMTSMFSRADGRPCVPSGQGSAPALRGGVWTGSRWGPHRGHTVTDPQGHLGAWPRIGKVVGGAGIPPGAVLGRFPCRPPGSPASGLSRGRGR